MKKYKTFILALLIVIVFPLGINGGIYAQEELSDHTIFDDKLLLEGYAQRYRQLPKEVILEMIKDDTLDSYKTAAAVRVFRENYSHEVVSREKHGVEKILIRRLKLTDSPFVEVEIMHTLCQLDRYRYFDTMVPALIQKLSHYNSTVNEMASDSINQLLGSGGQRVREARIVFNTLRKILFLSRKRLASMTVADSQLARKLKLVRWSIKVLGSQELKKLPKEVISLL
jgi:hypothetical protein